MTKKKSLHKSRPPTFKLAGKKTKAKAKKMMKTTKKKTANAGGRPPSPFPGRYQLRHGDDQFAEWMRAAGVAEPGPLLQTWMRETLDAKARMSRKPAIKG